DRGPGKAAGVDGASVGEHDVHADDDVLDLAVPVAHLAGAAARQPPADGGQVDRLRPVARGDAVLPAQGLLQPGAEGPGLHVEHHRVPVDRHDAGEAGEVEHDAAVDR